MIRRIQFLNFCSKHEQFETKKFQAFFAFCCLYTSKTRETKHAKLFTVYKRASDGTPSFVYKDSFSCTQLKTLSRFVYST